MTPPVDVEGTTEERPRPRPKLDTAPWPKPEDLPDSTHADLMTVLRFEDGCTAFCKAHS